MRLGTRQYLSGIFWIVGTTAVVAGAQVVTTRAAAERRAVTRLNIALVENKVRIRELEAELRTRAGLPELQRWNDAVFQLSAPQTGQILQSPVQLAAYAARPEAAAPAGPAVRYALVEKGTQDELAPPPAATGGARVVTASYPTAMNAGPAAAPAAPTTSTIAVVPLPDLSPDLPEPKATGPQDGEG